MRKTKYLLLGLLFLTGCGSSFDKADRFAKAAATFCECHGGADLAWATEDFSYASVVCRDGTSTMGPNVMAFSVSCK